MKKKNVIFLFNLCICLLCNYEYKLIVFANELESDVFISFLVDEGISYKSIKNLSKFTLESLTNDIKSTKNYNIIFSSKNVDDDIITTYSTIPNEDFSLIIFMSDFEYKTDFLTGFEVKLYYDWSNPPVWRLKDPMAFTFDNDILQVVKNSFYHEDRYYRNGDNLYICDSSCENNYDTIKWIAELKSGYFMGIGGTITRLYGFGKFKMALKKETKYLDTFISGTYIHSKVANANLNLNNTTGYSISGSYDQLTIDKNINND